ncbi:hypothetical protein [Caudoviricetes sp.]|nr:hypothetical protein [Caudoviricetes sp.]
MGGLPLPSGQPANTRLIYSAHNNHYVKSYLLDL